MATQASERSEGLDAIASALLRVFTEGNPESDLGLMPAANLKVEGDAATGYRLRQGESKFQVFFVAEGGKLRVRAINSMDSQLAPEAFGRASAGDVKGASVWLKWSEENSDRVKGMPTGTVLETVKLRAAILAAPAGNSEVTSHLRSTYDTRKTLREKVRISQALSEVAAQTATARSTSSSMRSRRKTLRKVKSSS